MEQLQRTRILQALAELMAERGPAAGTVTPAEVVERAGVSREVFEAHFNDREACLLAAFELGLERLAPPVIAAYRSEARWLDAVKAGLAVLLHRLEAEPALGRLVVVHSMGGGAGVMRRRMAILDALAVVIDMGRAQVPAGRQPPSLVAEGVVGAVVAVLQNRLLAEPRTALSELFGPLVSMIVLPYLGAGAARRELDRPAPRPRVLAGIDGGQAPPQGLVRLTYRTRRVLGAIGDYPGASNREVAERAGILDQGQISKLLSRLEARALVERIGESRSRGAPNSWRLTDRGELLMRDALASRSGIGRSGPPLHVG